MNNFTIKCNKCGNENIKIIRNTEYDGYDEACGDSFEIVCYGCNNTEEIEGE